MSATEPISARQRLRTLRMQQLHAGADIAPSAVRRDVDGKQFAVRPIPLTHTQQRAWFLAQLDPLSTAYNEARAHRLSGPLNLPALEGALASLIERHEILRTTVAMVGHEPVQQLRRDIPLAFERVDLSTHPQDAREQDLETALNAWCQEPFDLTLGPLVRFRVVRLADNEHVLLRTWHHIVTDGWSVEVFERELSLLYEALVSGRPTPLAALPIQYADYALWQRQWLAGPLLQQQLSYWKRQLADLSTLALPTDRPRPAMQSDRGAVLAVALPAELAQRLRALARAEGTTLFMAGLAAFNVLLYRYSGTSDVAVGTPIAGRGRTELEGLIGFLANTLVLRTDLSGGPSFRALLARVRACALNAYTHQDLPFERLVEELAPLRDLSRNPLFQVCFALHDAAGPGLTLHGLQVQPIELPTRHAKFDLSLDLREREGTLHACFEFCTDLFEHATIQRMAEHFTVLLAAIVEDPQQCIDALPLMSAAERQRILVQFNDTARPYPKNVSLAALFQAQVLRSPHACALVHDDTILTYAQLNSQANQLAHHLIQLGVRADVCVAICMHRSPSLIVSILAVLKAGGTYVPLDPQLPQQRLAFMLDDSHATLLLVHSATRDRFDIADARMLCVHDQRDAIATRPADNPTTQVTPERLAYIIYTSGTTGAPKGVQVPEHGVVNHISWIIDRLKLQTTDRVLHFTSVGFDASVWEMLAPLQVGASLYLAQSGAERDMAGIARCVHEQKLSVLQVVPSMLRALLNEKLLQQCTSLRTIACGGEALDYELVDRLREQAPWVWLGNFYGPTEASTDATCLELTAQSRGAGIVPIGRPIANVRCHVLDRLQQPVPVGVIGELHIGGIGLARGYVNQPQLSAERFIADPFQPGERLYRTGDLARYLSDGSIAFVGRNDDQVKIRGFRIETAEVAAALAMHPDIRACHVVARRQANGELGLTAYLVPARVSDGHLSVSKLRGFLSERLPAYMIPSSYVPLESMPLTINGKIDVGSLPDPATARQIESVESVVPRDSTERTISQVWAEVLGAQSVGLDDNFFEVGGHSLLAARMFARLDEEFGRSLPLSVLFAAPTVRQLAERFRDLKAHAAQAARALVPLRGDGARPALYLLPGVFGNVVGYADVVRALGPDQPVLGLQSIGLDGLAAPLDSMEAIARHNVAEIRAHQPDGPYAIIGVCFGATVAYEICRQLLAQGQVVAYLGLIAPTAREGHLAQATGARAPRSVQRAAALAQLLKSRLRSYAHEMGGLSAIDRPRYLVNKLRSLAKSAAGPNAFKGAARELNQLEVYRANVHALDSYRRLPLVGNLVMLDVFESEATLRRANQGPINWKEYWRGPIFQHMVAGDDSGHMISGRNATLIGRKLAERLQTAFDGSAGQHSG